jgi:ankyrin repeat protein
MAKRGYTIATLVGCLNAIINRGDDEDYEDVDQADETGMTEVLRNTPAIVAIRDAQDRAIACLHLVMANRDPADTKTINDDDDDDESSMIHNALDRAVYMNWTRFAEIVIRQYGADPNMYTPLFWVKTVEMARVLLDNGADVGQVDDDLNTALFHIENLDVVRYLVEERHADVNRRNKEGKTVIHAHRTVNIIRYFIGRGVDVNAADTKGRTVLMNFCLDLDVVRFLVLEARINASLRDGNGRVAIFYFQDRRTLEFLVKEAKIDVNACDNTGKTALMVQSNFGKIATAFFIEVLGANPNIRDVNGNTVAHMCSSVESLRYLDEIGVPLVSLNSDGRDPLMMNIIFARKTNRQPSLDVLRFYHSKGCSVNRPDAHGYSAMLVWKDFSTLQFLVDECGGDVNFEAVKDHVTPLVCAWAASSPEAIAFLISKGADIHKRVTKSEMSFMSLMMIPAGSKYRVDQGGVVV